MQYIESLRSLDEGLWQKFTHQDDEHQGYQEPDLRELITSVQETVKDYFPFAEEKLVDRWIREMISELAKQDRKAGSFMTNFLD